MLKDWKPLPLSDPETQAWIAQVLGYFKGMYRNPDMSGTRQWSASDMLVRDWNPMEHLSDHAGVRFIRTYYPSFSPTPADFERAKWGKSPRRHPGHPPRRRR